MKDAPALLCAILSVKAPGLLNDIFFRVIDNAKMLRNFIQEGYGILTFHLTPCSPRNLKKLQGKIILPRFGTVLWRQSDSVLELN